MENSSRSPSALDPKITVEELLRQRPNAIMVFVHHRMACVGCWMSRFDTLADVAWNYDLDTDQFLHELGEII